jgi:hypothetical protein
LAVMAAKGKNLPKDIVFEQTEKANP